MNAHRTTALFASVAMLAGCQGEDVVVGLSSQAAMTQNAMTQNAMTQNAMTQNAMTQNAMTQNALGSLATTEDGRMLLRYVARCALVSGDVLSVEHDDATYEFPGLLGLAPAWKARGLAENEVRIVSACLIAHVNAYGVSVPISVRSAGYLAADAEEMKLYPVFEGTFFGQLFSDSSRAYSCIGDNADIAAVHSSDRRLRVCTDGGKECAAITSLGYCEDVCESYTPKHGWQGCWAGGVRYDETVSVYLHDQDFKHNQSCTGDACTLEATVDSILDCNQAGTCNTVCGNGTTCTIDGSAAGSVSATVSGSAAAAVNGYGAELVQTTCTGGSYCDVGGNGAGRLVVNVTNGSTAEVRGRVTGECEAACAGDSTCAIDATEAGLTRIDCTGGAQCVLECASEAECGFETCEGQQQVCEGGVVVCNRPCPRL